MTQDELYPILLSGIAGGVAASLLGRDKTRIANLAIGAIFTAAMAHYDKPGGTAVTVLVAAVEGAAWGATDRLVPMIKHRVFDPSPKPLRIQT